MKKFEYLIIPDQIYLHGYELDEYGYRSWELASVVETRKGTEFECARYDYIFKRECGDTNDSLPSSYGLERPLRYR